MSIKYLFKKIIYLISQIFFHMKFFYTFSFFVPLILCTKMFSWFVNACAISFVVLFPIMIYESHSSVAIQGVQGNVVINLGLEKNVADF